MYDFRSRFLHGDYDFDGPVLLGDAEEVVGKYSAELIESISLAVAILTATLQEMIKRNWTSLNFSYEVAGN